MSLCGNDIRPGSHLGIIYIPSETEPRPQILISATGDGPTMTLEAALPDPNRTTL